MAGYAIFTHKGFDRLFKLLVDISGGGTSGAGGVSGRTRHGGWGEGEGEEKGPKLHYKAPLASMQAAKLIGSVLYL
jgi:hypothetical protein